MGGESSVPITQLDDNRTIVVTGASSGQNIFHFNCLGYEIAKWCSMMGATVIMACRSEQKTKEAIERMNSELREEKARGTKGLTQGETLALQYMHVELSSFKSVVKFAEEFKKSYSSLHVLFLNAGYALAPYRKSEDGLENVLQVNYLSQFLMTAKLLPIMNQSGEDCRVILMSSEAHRFANLDIENMNYTGPPEKFPQMASYGNSKLFQIMQMYCMVRRLKGTSITVNCIHPGIVETNFGSERTGFWACLAPCMLCCAGKKSSRAAIFSINCATGPSFEGVTGRYFYDYKKRKLLQLQETKNSKNKYGTKLGRLLESLLRKKSEKPWRDNKRSQI